VDYSEEAASFNDKVRGPKGERRVVSIRREDLDSSLFSAPKIRSKVDSGKGVRIQVTFLSGIQHPSTINHNLHITLSNPASRC
jgi:hypothetical protein